MPKRADDDDLDHLTVRDSATRLRVCTATVRRWIERGDLQAVRLGRVIRVPASALIGLAGNGASPRRPRPKRRRIPRDGGMLK